MKVVKNKVAPPFTEAEFDIRWGVGIDTLADLVESAQAAGVIEKAATTSPSRARASDRGVTAPATPSPPMRPSSKRSAPRPSTRCRRKRIARSRAPRVEQEPESGAAEIIFARRPGWGRREAGPQRWSCRLPGRLRVLTASCISKVAKDSWRMGDAGAVSLRYEAGAPKRLEVSWKGMWKEMQVAFDGVVVGTFANEKELEQGREFTLSDGSLLAVTLKSNFRGLLSELLRDGYARCPRATRSRSSE